MITAVTLDEHGRLSRDTDPALCRDPAFRTSVMVARGAWDAGQCIFCNEHFGAHGDAGRECPPP